MRSRPELDCKHILGVFRARGCGPKCRSPLLRGARRAPPNPFVGFEGHFEVGTERGREGREGKRKGTKGIEGTGENTPL